MASTAAAQSNSSGRGVIAAQVLVASWLALEIGGGLVIYSHFGALGAAGVSWRFNLTTVLLLIAGLIPGLVLGGWKALLVATGRSSIAGKIDIVWLSAFGLWIIGTTLLALINLIRYW